MSPVLGGRTETGRRAEEAASQRAARTLGGGGRRGACRERCAVRYNGGVCALVECEPCENVGAQHPGILQVRQEGEAGGTQCAARVSRETELLSPELGLEPPPCSRLNEDAPPRPPRPPRRLPSVYPRRPRTHAPQGTELCAWGGGVSSVIWLLWLCQREAP